jgi:hypothetical protein
VQAFADPPLHNRLSLSQIQFRPEIRRAFIERPLKLLESLNHDRATSSNRDPASGLLIARTRASHRSTHRHLRQAQFWPAWESVAVYKQSAAQLAACPFLPRSVCPSLVSYNFTSPPLSMGNDAPPTQKSHGKNSHNTKVKRKSGHANFAPRAFAITEDKGKGMAASFLQFW